MIFPVLFKAGPCFERAEYRHCEEQSDEAIHCKKKWIASLRSQ
ncbi:hypothetical protein CSIRO_0170 [Bradyrhizobiaceae bacterium SG-6C]|nr:hypothetical protein CSIRO_0170 [Bradyrhizobiaceae bacterium SG-6C]